MKQTLFKRKGQLILMSLFLVLILFITLVKVDYTMTAPGQNDEVGSFITIDDSYKQEGSFHTTSVMVVKRMSLLQKYIADRENTIEVREIPDYYDRIDDLDDLDVMGYLMKDDSIFNALVVGIKNANKEITYEVNNVVYLIYNYMTPNTLEIGDIVLSVNGEDPYTETSNTVCGNTATFEVLRDEEVLTFELTKNYYNDDSCAFGFYMDNFTEVTDSEVEYEIHKDLTGGPSGGLMQSLYVFNLLTPHDITGGRKIAGTGTIDVDGNVGLIGGIEQKIITSALNGIDIFFVPHLSDSETDNYIVAKAVLESLDSDMTLIPVKTFDDAKNYLERKYGGAFDE